MNIESKELKENYEDGYRLVYFKKDGTYSIGVYSKTIEGFMMGLAEYDPIDDIPSFIQQKMF